MHARFSLVATAVLVLGACDASKGTKLEIESKLHDALDSSLAQKKVKCSLEHAKTRPEKLRVFCQSPEMGHVPLANEVKNVLTANCASLKRANFEKVEIDVPRSSGGNHTVWGTVGDDCDDWMSLTGLF